MRHILPIFVVAASLLAGAVYAASPADVIAARQQNYKAIGRANKGIMDELKGAAPSVQVIRDNAKVLGDLAPKLPSWFPKGTGPEAGVKTQALPVIWEKRADFDTAARNFAVAVNALNLAAAKGDIAQITNAAHNVGGTCKACHDQFRAKE